MIFGEMQYEQDYSEFHSELLEFVDLNFREIKHGLQGDSWIWIFEGDEKVEIDTFYSMKHQIKSASPARHLVRKVINVLSTRYDITVYEEPELEPHEED